MALETQESSPELPNYKPRLFGITIIASIITIAGLLLVGRLVEADTVRNLQTWQEKLGLVAESRGAEVSAWVEGRGKELRSLADNPSLQLYLTQLQTMPELAADDSSEKAYLHNLLLFTSYHGGFGKAAPSSIPANVDSAAGGGLMVLNNANELVVSTPLAPAVKDVMIKQAAVTAAGKETLIDISEIDGGSYMGYVIPVYAIQAEHTADTQIGRIVGLTAVDGNLFGLLKHPGITEKTLETILVRPAEGGLEMLSPLQDGNEPVAKKPIQNANSAESALVISPGNFVSDKADVSGKTVLATSRSIDGTSWILISKIDRSEALAASEQQRASMLTLAFLVISIVVLTIIAVWRQAHAKHADALSGYFQRLAAKSQAQERLLRLVADHQPEALYIVDEAHRLHFANQKAASDAGMKLESMPDKALGDVRGITQADVIIQQCDRALAQKETLYKVERSGEGEQELVTRIAYVPIEHIPLVHLTEPTPGVLVVEQDISDVVHEREHRTDILRKLVQMLVKLVDQRDPFAANHSLLVSELSGQVAAELGLEESVQEATKLAASLMNIGKIVVPAELLTKTDSLTAEEKIIVRNSMDIAAKMIKDIRFDGPVMETLQQWQEKWDGSGPLKLKGESILISARIIAVANAFIGMISPRSWRDALKIEQATKQLLDQSGKDFDRKVAIRLVHHVENEQGKEWIEKVMAGKK